MGEESNVARSVSRKATPDGALPPDWDELWGRPRPKFAEEIASLRQRFESLACDVELYDRSEVFSALVSSKENRLKPVHRWFSYKEAYSYRLPREVLREVGAGEGRRVADVFGGVATCGLSLQLDPRVSQVVSVEYSPLAHFVGRVKLAWNELDPSRLRAAARRLSEFSTRRATVPTLAAFHNPEIFDPATARALVAARDAVKRSRLTQAEKDFFLLGIASIVEDVSGAMKDGRALRIVRERRRRPTSLIPLGELPAFGAERVRASVIAQWGAMIDDLVLLREQVGAHVASVSHLRGDARELAHLAQPIADGSIGLHVYSPPYLNCIDYSEIYKLELWLLEFVNDQKSFKELRLGTLRSHPSVEFPSRGYLDSAGSELRSLVEDVGEFAARSGTRSNTGRMITNYFDDMHRVLAEQFRTLEPAGHAACVVANSTFSRRETDRGRVRDCWRMPVLTDVIVSALARDVGFAHTEIWNARSLRPRNVRGGSARESIIVMRR